jgi:hypothetical protein
VLMTAGERGGSMTQAWSVDDAHMSMLRRSNRLGTGSASVTVQGAGMGLTTYTGHVRAGQTGCEATEWESETAMRCLVGHGVLGTRRVVMTMGERGGSLTQVWSVDAVLMSSLRHINHAGSGSASVTIYGSSMGLVTYTGTAREGQTGCEATEWESETAVRCLIGHGARGTRRVVMTAGALGESATQSWSADAAALSMHPANLRGMVLGALAEYC